MSVEITVDPNPQARKAHQLSPGTFVHRRSDSDAQPFVYFLSCTDECEPELRTYFLTDMRQGRTQIVQHDAVFIPYSGATIQVTR